METFTQAFSFLKCTSCKKQFGFNEKIVSCAQKDSEICYDHHSACGKCIYKHASTTHEAIKEGYLEMGIKRRYDIEDRVSEFTIKMEQRFFFDYVPKEETYPEEDETQTCLSISSQDESPEGGIDNWDTENPEDIDGNEQAIEPSFDQELNWNTLNNRFNQLSQNQSTPNDEKSQIPDDIREAFREKIADLAAAVEPLIKNRRELGRQIEKTLFDQAQNGEVYVNDTFNYVAQVQSGLREMRQTAQQKTVTPVSEKRDSIPEAQAVVEPKENEIPEPVVQAVPPKPQDWRKEVPMQLRDSFIKQYTEALNSQTRHNDGFMRIHNSRVAKQKEMEILNASTDQEDYERKMSLEGRIVKAVITKRSMTSIRQEEEAQAKMENQKKKDAEKEEEMTEACNPNGSSSTQIGQRVTETETDTKKDWREQVPMELRYHLTAEYADALNMKTPQTEGFLRIHNHRQAKLKEIEAFDTAMNQIDYEHKMKQARLAIKSVLLGRSMRSLSQEEAAKKWDPPEISEAEKQRLILMAVLKKRSMTSIVQEEEAEAIKEAKAVIKTLEEEKNKRKKALSETSEESSTQRSQDLINQGVGSKKALVVPPPKQEDNKNSWTPAFDLGGVQDSCFTKFYNSTSKSYNPSGINEAPVANVNAVPQFEQVGQSLPEFGFRFGRPFDLPTASSSSQTFSGTTNSSLNSSCPQAKMNSSYLANLRATTQAQNASKQAPMSNTNSQLWGYNGLTGTSSNIGLTYPMSWGPMIPFHGFPQIIPNYPTTSTTSLDEMAKKRQEALKEALEQGKRENILRQLVISLPSKTPAVLKPWHQETTRGARDQLIVRLSASMCSPSSFQDVSQREIRSVVARAYQVENEFYENANDKDEYYRLMSSKFGKLFDNDDEQQAAEKSFKQPVVVPKEVSKTKASDNEICNLDSVTVKDQQIQCDREEKLKDWNSQATVSSQPVLMQRSTSAPLIAKGFFKTLTDDSISGLNQSVGESVDQDSTPLAPQPLYAVVEVEVSQDEQVDGEQQFEEQEAQKESIDMIDLDSSESIDSNESKNDESSDDGYDKTITYEKMQIGSWVLAEWNPQYNTYTLVSQSKVPYIVKDSSIEELKKTGRTENGFLARITQIEYCAIKKQDNRYKLPIGTRAFRVELEAIEFD